MGILPLKPLPGGMMYEYFITMTIHRLFITALTLCLTAAPVFADGLLPIKLPGIKSLTRGSIFGQELSGPTVFVDYKVEGGPGKNLPEVPPHIKDRHIANLQTGLAQVEQDAIAKAAAHYGLVLPDQKAKEALHGVFSDWAESWAPFTKWGRIRKAKKAGVPLDTPAAEDAFEELIAKTNLPDDIFLTDDVRDWYQIYSAIDINSVSIIPEAHWDKIVTATVASARKSLDYTQPERGWKETTTAMMRGAVGALDRSKHPHTFFHSAKEMEAIIESMKGDGFTGIGVNIEKSRTADGVLIILVIPNSGAKKGGLQSEDVILAVSNSRGGPPTWEPEGTDWDLGKAAEKIRGPAGSFVYLTIKRDSAAPKVYKILRAQVDTPNVYARKYPGNIGYVYFTQWDNNTETEVIGAIDAFGPLSGLIVDVRYNGGGSLGQAAEVTSEFLKDGQNIVITRIQGKLVGRFYTDGDGKHDDVKMVVLMNGRSASASEVFGAAMQAHGRAMIVGQQSYEKGSVQSVSWQPGKRGLLVTSQYFYGPHGKKIRADRTAEGKKIPNTGGITPDVAVAVSDQQFVGIFNDIIDHLYGQTPKSPTADPQLEKALELLRPKT